MNEKHVPSISELEHFKNVSEEEFLNQATATRMKHKGSWQNKFIILGSIYIVIFVILMSTISIRGFMALLYLALLGGIFSAIIFRNYKSSKNKAGSIMAGTGIDFSSMNLEELNNQINYYLNKGEPITLWGMSRENEKLILKSEKVLILQKLFEYLKGMGESLAEYKAGVFLHDEYIQNYINDYRMSRNRQAEINDQLHFNKMLELKNVERNMHLDYANQEIEILRKQAEVERIKAETDIMRIQAQSDAAYREAKNHWSN